VFSDLFAPDGKTPLFAQTYTIDPAAQLQLRKKHLSSTSKVKEDIIQMLQEILNECHPYAKTFKSAAQKIKEIEEKKGKLPNFQVIL